MKFFFYKTNFTANLAYKRNSIFTFKNFFVNSLIQPNYKNHRFILQKYQYNLYVTFISSSIHKVRAFNTLKSSLYRSSPLHEFINKFLKRGNKLKSLNTLNILINSFYYLYINSNVDFITKYPSYLAFSNFSKMHKQFFNLDFILKMMSSLNETVFDLKIIKLSKKSKKKKKAKYDCEFKYISRERRFSNFLRNLVLISNDYNYYKFSDRLISSFFDTFYLQKNSELTKRKLFIYKMILKKKSSSPEIKT